MEKLLPNKCILVYSPETNMVETTCTCPEDRSLCVYGRQHKTLRWMKCKYCKDDGEVLNNCTSLVALVNVVYRLKEWMF